MLPSILALGLLATVSAENRIGGHLFSRQDLCNPSDQPVGACGPEDLSTTNWAAFDIDTFLSDFALNFGVGAGSAIPFPGFFVQENLVPGADFLFDCTTPGSSLCSHPAGVNPTVQTDCAFKEIPNVASTACGKYISPQAGFVVENFIRFHQGVSNNFFAIEDAGNAILTSTFIDDVVDGLSEEQGNILEAIFEAIAGFVLGILPFGRAFRLGVEMFKKLDTIYQLGGADAALSSELDVLKTIAANEAIQDLAERTKDQLRRQIEEMIVSTQRRM